MEKIKVSIIIINYNTKEVTLNCVRSLLKNTKKVNFEIILIDNGSKENFQLPILNFQNLRLIKNAKNLGFARANNQGIKVAKGDYVLFLNSDTVIKDNVIGEMSKWMDKNSKIGISSCKLLNNDGSVQGTGGYFPSLLKVFLWMTIEDIPGVDKLIKPFHPKPWHYEKQKELDWLTGAFMFIRKKVIDEVGDLDTDFFMYTEDVDFCFRAKKAGWKVIYLPRFAITHLGGASSTSEFPIVSEFNGIKLFYKKHYPVWQYPLLRVLLKIGAALRILVLGIIYGREAIRTYARAFKAA